MNNTRFFLSYGVNRIYFIFFIMGIVLLYAYPALSINGSLPPEQIDCSECHGVMDNGKMHHQHVYQPINPLIRPYPNGDNPDGTYGCLSCHHMESDPQTGIITISPFRICTDCHTALSDPIAMHHATQWALTGDCTYCHAVPIWADTAPQQAACRQCHIDQNGFVQAADGTSPIVSHAFNTQGPIQDFGACFYCHTPVPYHGKPATHPEWWASIQGRGSFNIFYSEFHNFHSKKYWDDHKQSAPSPPYAQGITIRSKNYDDMKDFTKNEIKDTQSQPWSHPGVAFNWTTIIHVNGTSYDIPVFDTLYGQQATVRDRSFYSCFKYGEW